MELDLNAWASGQTLSKQWLSSEIENIFQHEEPLTIWFYGGWYGLGAQVIFLRENLNIEEIINFDKDPSCQEISEKMNKAWCFDEKKFKSFTEDCNSIKTCQWQQWSSKNPNIIINCSLEAFESNEWWHSISENQMVALQASNSKTFQKDGYLNNFTVNSIEEFKAAFPMKKILFSGEKKFDYGNETSFSRFMLIGHK